MNAKRKGSLAISAEGAHSSVENRWRSGRDTQRRRKGWLRTASEQANGADEAVRFAPVSLVNPGGRSKGLMRAIRESTGNGDELAAFMLGVFRGEHKSASLRDQMEAARWLADRGFGRPAQALQHINLDVARQATVALAKGMGDAVKRHVTDEATLAAIGAELTRLAETAQAEPTGF